MRVSRVCAPTCLRGPREGKLEVLAIYCKESYLSAEKDIVCAPDDRLKTECAPIQKIDDGVITFK